jgi:hypothetical protein
MQNPELEKTIIERLAKTTSENELIFELCETHGLSWTEADALIRRIKAEHADSIENRRFPILFITAFSIFIGGLALAIYDLYVFINLIEIEFQHAQTEVDKLYNLRLLFELGLAPVSGVALGTAMMLGSLLGMRRAWSPILNRLLGKMQE